MERICSKCNKKELTFDGGTGRLGTEVGETGICLGCYFEIPYNLIEGKGYKEVCETIAKSGILKKDNFNPSGEEIFNHYLGDSGSLAFLYRDALKKINS